MSVDGYERVLVFALCPEKITPDGFAVPNIFCQKKVGRKKRPSRKGVLKKGL